MPPKTKTRKSSAVVPSSPASPGVGADTGSTGSPPPTGLPDSQATTITELSHLPDPIGSSSLTPSTGQAPPSIPPLDIADVFTASPLTTPYYPAVVSNGPPSSSRTRQRAALMRAESTQMQADVASLSDNQSSAEKKIKDNAIACARNRLEDRRTLDTRLNDLDDSLCQFIHEELSTLREDIASVRTHLEQLQVKADSAQNRLENHADRIDFHGTDLENLLTESNALKQSIDRLDDHIDERVSGIQSNIQTCQSDIRSIKLDVKAQLKFRRTTQDELTQLHKQLATIEEDVIPAIIDGELAERGFSTDRERVPDPKGKGKQRATSTGSESDYGSEWAPNFGGEDESESDHWSAQLRAISCPVPQQASAGEPSSPTSHKRQMDFTPEKRDDQPKRARETGYPPSSSVGPASMPTSVSLPIGLTTLTTAGHINPTLTQPAPTVQLPTVTPLSQLEVARLPPLPLVSTNPQPPRARLSPLPITFPGAEPDLLPHEAMEKGVTRIIMKSLGGKDFFSTTDKMFNYTIFRQINLFLGKQCAPALNPEPEGNTLISTTETSFSYSKPEDVRSVLSAWRFHPDSLHDLGIYQYQPSTSQPASQSSSLQAILDMDTSASSRGRPRHRGSRGSLRGTGRGRGGWY
ncbi:hypothetical protein M407DRAFT_30301 [Tulasnella calospora MUT 4182]|uniref:Uncharacterized protein n=1 Tax=Tulasnella calospora MUT 4182 TaxID=1051891 RepID=A0A0C3PXZ3_9AGAM|nr:hypothetical protein M407DRAFT_30301 [Tulasnella calospora MUT 4182]